MKKYSGQTFSDEGLVLSKEGQAVNIQRKFEVKKLPKFLFFSIKRFSKNNFFKEKNSTIVNFPLTGLDLSEICPDQPGYDLIGNVIH